MLKHLFEKLKEAVFAVFPVTLIVLLLCFTIVDVSADFIILFLIGALLLILGMTLFTLGTKFI